MHWQGQIVLVLEIIGKNMHILLEVLDAHVGQVLQLCRDADVKGALD